MKNINLIFISTFLLTTLILSCSKKDDEQTPAPDPQAQNLTIFFVNDVHGQIDNFSKIKYIVEQEEQHTQVIVAGSGDMFSGNPIVDNYQEKGYPMIDLMNEAGFDIAVLGNHEFDYGQATLNDRISQSQFDWVCANLEENAITGFSKHKTLEVGGMKLTFLGLIETNGKEGATIPATHPWKVEGLTFTPPQNAVTEYDDLKAQEDADLYIALTHIGSWSDIYFSKYFPYFDLIIGGHTHDALDTVVNNIPIYHAGDYLHFLGKIVIEVKAKEVQHISFELIDLDQYNDFDAGVQSKIDNYNSSMPSLNDIIGYSSTFHSRYYNVGCFYTDAMREQMDVDVSFQNVGGIRNNLDEGDITKGEIYAISPFNNGTIIYTMTVSEIKTFLSGSASGFYYAGLSLEQSGNEIVVRDPDNNQILPDHTSLTVGVNDYIAAVYDLYFPPPSEGNILAWTDVEIIIDYLESHHQPINYPECGRYFRYE